MSGAHLKAKMSLDSKGVKAGTKGATKEVNSFSKQLGKIGPQLAAAFSVGAIAGFTKKVIDYGSQISDLAYQTSLSNEQLQAFQVAVTNAGGSVEQAAKGLMSLRDAQDAALGGEAMYVRGFENLRISVEQLANSTMPQLLEAVAANYREVQDFGALVDLFGKRNAGRLEEALIALADNGFGGLVESAKEAGMVISDERIWRLDAMADSWERMLIRMKVGFADLMFDLEKIWRPISRFFDATKEGLMAGIGAVGTDLKNIVTGKWGEKSQTASLLPVMGRASAWSWTKDKQTEAEVDKERVKNREDRAKKQEERELKQAQTRALKIAGIYADEDDKALKKSTHTAEQIKKIVAAAPGVLGEESGADGGGEITSAFMNPAVEYSQLRRIGANVLGSGVAGGKVMSKEAQIASATERTARAAEELVRNSNRPTAQTPVQVV